MGELGWTDPQSLRLNLILLPEIYNKKQPFPSKSLKNLNVSPKVSYFWTKINQLFFPNLIWSRQNLIRSFIIKYMMLTWIFVCNMLFQESSEVQEAIALHALLLRRPTSRLQSIPWVLWIFVLDKFYCWCCSDMRLLTWVEIIKKIERILLCIELCFFFFHLLNLLSQMRGGGEHIWGSTYVYLP